MRILFLFSFLILNSVHIHSQCLDDDIIMYPAKSVTAFTEFGENVLLQGDYLITSASAHDSLAYQGGMVIVYEYIIDRWEKIAELTASESTKGMRLGDQIAANSNRIAAKANIYTEEGFNYEKVYVFEKEEGATWTSQNESYIIDPAPLVGEPDWRGVRVTFDLSEDFLSVYYYHLQEARNNIYQFNNGSVSLFESLDGLQHEDGYYVSDATVKLGKDFVVISDANFDIPGQNSGKVFIYNYDDVNGWDEHPIELTSSLSNQIGFGTVVDVYNDYVFISNARGSQEEGSQAYVFVYEKSGDKWTDTTEKAILSPGPSDGFYNYGLAGNDQYLIHSFPSKQILSVFKKGTDWEDKGAPDFLISVAKPNREAGRKMDINDQHFVYNSNDFEFSDNAIVGGELNTVELDEFFENNNGSTTQTIYQHSLSSSGDEFSNSSSFYKSLGAVGSNLDDDRGFVSGAVTIYERNEDDLSWKIASKIYSPNIQSYQNFGHAVEVTDNYLFASSPYYDSLDENGNAVISDMGKVYQFKKKGDTWEFFQSIISPDVKLLGASDPGMDTYREFGRQMKYYNGYLAVGQRFFGGSNYKGRIYIFKENDQKQWEYKATLQASNEVSRDQIGYYSFFMNDTLVIAGSPVYGPGAAFIFKRKPNEEWQSGMEAARLLPDRKELSESNLPVEEFDFFGTDVDVHGEYVVVGAPYGERDDRQGPNSGRAYLYKMPKGGWSGEIKHQHILKPGERIIDGNFGYGVYIDQKNILVGAPHSLSKRGSGSSYNLEESTEPGRIYVFDRGQINEDEEIMNEVGQILPTGGHPLDGFGATITKNFIEIVISAPLSDTENGDRSGAAYMFKKVSAIEENILPVCVDHETIDLVAYPVSGGTWSGIGIVDTDQGIFDPSILEEGTYTIRYQYGECISSTEISVYTQPIIIDTSESEQFLCPDGTLDLFVESNKSNHDYEWYYKESASGQYDHIIDWDGQKAISVDAAGYYYCIALNPACSSNPVYFEIAEVVESLALNQSDSVRYCKGESFMLSLASESTMENYAWFYRADTSSNPYDSISGVSIQEISTSGNYFCRFTSKGCVFYSDTLNVQFDIERSALNYSRNYELCMNESIDVILQSEAGPMIDYQWYVDPTGFGDYQLKSDHSEITVNESGSYYCRSVKSTGCVFISDTLEVTQTNIELIFEPIETICNPFVQVELVAFPLGGTFEILNFGSFNDPILVSDFLENGSYEISYEVEINGCHYKTFQEFEVNVLEKDNLFVPNVFTPNDDGLNDHFSIEGASPSMARFQLNILNRAGDVVFQTSNPEFEWSGANQSSGVYYWSMVFHDNCTSRPFQMKGYVQLMR